MIITILHQEIVICLQLYDLPQLVGGKGGSEGDSSPTASCSGAISGSKFYVKNRKYWRSRVSLSRHVTHKHHGAGRKTRNEK